MRELVRGQFANQQRPGRVEPRDDRGVAIRYMVARRA